MNGRESTYRDAPGGEDRAGHDRSFWFASVTGCPASLQFL
jgi:hypothetical protein